MADLDCTNSLQPCNCSSNQICVQIGRSGTECAKNTCVDKQGGSGSGNSNGGKNSVGAVAGQAVGGVIGGLAIIVAVYWFWWRKRKGRNGNSSSPRSAKSSSSSRSAPNSANPKGLRDFRIGQGQQKSPNTIHSNGEGKGEKQYNYHPGHHHPSSNITAPPGPGEEDAQPVKRQSLRFDPSNNGTTSVITNRRSLSGAGKNMMLPSSTPISSTSGIAKADNPFGDHHNVDSSSNNNNNNNNNNKGEQDDNNAASRQSAATISEFSFRSSHSTNIIPIAYIPAHSTQNSTIDMTALRDSRRPHSLSTSVSMAGYGHGQNANANNNNNGPGERGSRASVPLSLRSASTGTGTGTGSGMHDSRVTFSKLFDRRVSSQSMESTGTSNGGGGLEIIAATHLQQGHPQSPTPPLVTTPTFTKDGRPIRPPRAPGLDLKLPTPDAISPPTSPGFPWNNNKGTNSKASSPGTNSPHSHSQQHLSPAQANFPNSPAMPGPGSRSNRETLLSPTSTARDFAAHARASAYSTFSQATGSSGSHLSYILEAPQIVTPVSAGGVQVQTLNRAAARTVKLPSSGATGGSLSPHVAAMPPKSDSPTNAQMGAYPTSPNPQYVSSPLGRSRHGSNDSPISDNPFDDEMAVKIAIPSSQEGTPVLPLTPTFGTSPMHTPMRQESRPGTSTDVRDSMASSSNRRGSDLSIFTSTDAHNDDYDDHEQSGGRRTVRNSFASSSRASLQPGRRPSPSSFVGTTGHPAGSNKSGAASIASTSTSMADEVILSPPNRPFANEGGPNNGHTFGPDSRHNSAALSTRSGYASVLDGIPFNLSLSPEARHSQASDAGAPGGGLRESIPVHFGGGNPLHSSTGHGQGGVRDSTATYRTSVASSSMHSNDKRDTSYSLASEWNGAFAGMPIVMGGGLGEEAVPEVPSMYQQASRPTTSSGPAGGSDAAAASQQQQQEQRDMRYSTDSLALAAAVARQFDERED